MSRVRGIGRVRLAVRPAAHRAPARFVLVARRSHVRAVAFALDRRALPGAARRLTRTLRLRALPGGRHVLRVTITPKRGKAHTVTLAVRVARC
jgi:KaiC/GvpD/RAD55 family RecA-like ATPase